MKQFIVEIKKNTKDKFPYQIVVEGRAFDVATNVAIAKSSTTPKAVKMGTVWFLANKEEVLCLGDNSMVMLDTTIDLLGKNISSYYESIGDTDKAKHWGTSDSQIQDNKDKGRSM